ncbi:MAG: hypothetical protein Q9157_005722 [Trypethelium eluteriae]
MVSMASQSKIREKNNEDRQQSEAWSSVEEHPLTSVYTRQTDGRPSSDHGHGDVGRPSKTPQATVSRLHTNRADASGQLDGSPDPIIEQEPFHDGDKNGKQYKTMKWGFVS